MPKIISVRVAKAPISAETVQTFGQITVHFIGTQTVSTLDSNSTVVSTKSAPVSEYWVFERAVLPKTKWRVCTKFKPGELPSLSL